MQERGSPEHIESLHARASERSGQSDFGDDRYREGLEVLINAYLESPYLAEASWPALEEQIITALRGRLVSEQGWKNEPRWRDTQIEKPLFILGLPRTGTTALHRLLACDPANQTLPYWLGLHPIPRPACESWPDYEAYRQTHERLEALYEANPGMRAIHEMAAGEADECRLLRMQSFADFTFETAYVPAYRSWLMARSQSDTYTRYRDNLRLIGAGDERRWVLKCPGHLWALAELLEHFPDACIVQTHRAPEEVIPSSSSLRYAGTRATEPEISPELVGRDNLERWHAIVTRAGAVRASAPAEQFFDLDFETFVADPLGQVEEIYAHFDIPCSGEAREKMSKWHAARPKGGHGAHDYNAEEFGLSSEMIRERFKDYRAKYGLA